jgi:hypothetical protein
LVKSTRAHSRKHPVRSGQHRRQIDDVDLGLLLEPAFDRQHQSTVGLAPDQQPGAGSGQQERRDQQQHADQ